MSDKMESDTRKSETTTTKKDDFGVLPTYMGGGPKGLGDPDDRSLRTLEDHLITKRMREESKKMCPDEDKVFGDCLRQGGFFFFIRCRPANQELKKCQFKWFQSEEFRRKITEQYLDDRAKFRRTGITQKYLDHEKKKEKEFEEWLKHKQEHSETHAS